MARWQRTGGGRGALAKGVVMEREKGAVVTWVEGGYGFIRRDSGGPTVFVHHSNIEMGGFRRLNEGDLVEFSIGPGHQGRGTQAVKVRRL